MSGIDKFFTRRQIAEVLTKYDKTPAFYDARLARRTEARIKRAKEEFIQNLSVLEIGSVYPENDLETHFDLRFQEGLSELLNQFGQWEQTDKGWKLLGFTEAFQSALQADQLRRQGIREHREQSRTISNALSTLFRSNPDKLFSLDELSQMLNMEKNFLLPIVNSLIKHRKIKSIPSGRYRRYCLIKEE